MKRFFVTGIGTDVGKTIASAVLVEALKADYWKPVQAGSLEFSDTLKVKSLISNTSSFFHEERYRLNAPMSPHAAAKLENIKINLSDFILPETNNHLIIEGAGGLMVPLNDEGDLIVDLIPHLNAEVIVISHIYLGSINHTLMTLEILKQRNIRVAGLIFNGEKNQETESIIEKISGVKILGRIPQCEHLKPKFISEQSSQFEFMRK